MIDAPAFPTNSNSDPSTGTPSPTRQRPGSFLSRKKGYSLEDARPEPSKSMEQGELSSLFGQGIDPLKNEGVVE